MLAVNEAGGLRWAGNVGTGFDDAEIERLLARLRPLVRKTSPLAEVPKMPRVRKGDVCWVEPELVAEVRFAEWTHDGRLALAGLRGATRGQGGGGGAPRAGGDRNEVRKGKRVLKLSNLDKPFWPEEGITKGDLLAYYRDVAPVLVPHLRDRPFTMKRYPDGWNGKFFFQKDAPKHMPDWIPTRPFEASTRDKPPQRKVIDFPLVNDELALLWMVNMGCIDMNTWYSRVDKPVAAGLGALRPRPLARRRLPRDDPGRAADQGDARPARARVDSEDERLRGDPHPRADRAPPHVRADARVLGDRRRRDRRAHPGLATTQWVKAKRRGVLIDSNQNGEGKTIASAYSVRPKPGAPVSTPLRWDEVNESLDPAAFTMDAVLDRVAREGDLFEGVLSSKQSLSDALRSLK